MDAAEYKHVVLGLLLKYQTPSWSAMNTDHAVDDPADQNLPQGYGIAPKPPSACARISTIPRRKYLLGPREAAGPT